MARGAIEDLHLGVEGVKELVDGGGHPDVQMFLVLWLLPSVCCTSPRIVRRSTFLSLLLFEKELLPRRNERYGGLGLGGRDTTAQCTQGTNLGLLGRLLSVCVRRFYLRYAML